MDYKPKVFKPKKCAWEKCCKTFTPERNFQKTCFNTVCAYGYVNQQKALKESKDWNKQKKVIVEKIKSHADHLKELQKIFNTYIRERDKNLPCISCGTTKSYIDYHAGHFYSVGAYPNLRFNEDNVHKQCGFNCNTSKHGNILEYRKGIIAKIGAERFYQLELQSSKPLKLSIPEITELKQNYKLKIKQLKDENTNF